MPMNDLLGQALNGYLTAGAFVGLAFMVVKVSQAVVAGTLSMITGDWYLVAYFVLMSEILPIMVALIVMVNITLELRKHDQKLKHISSRCLYTMKTARKEFYIDKKIIGGQEVKRQSPEDTMENVSQALAALAVTIEMEDTAPKLLGISATPAGFRFIAGYIGSSVAAIGLMLVFGN